MTHKDYRLITPGIYVKEQWTLLVRLERIPIMANKLPKNINPRISNSEIILTGPLYQMIWTISHPVIINNHIMTFYNMADAVFTGQL